MYSSCESIIHGYEQEKTMLCAEQQKNPFPPQTVEEQIVGI